MQREVLALDKEFGDRVAPKNVDATVDPGKGQVRKLGFDNHGLVVRDGGGRVVFKQPDHTVKIEDVRAAVREKLGS